MVEMTHPSVKAGRWPAARRIAWTALFIAILGWSSLLHPAPPPEVLPWTGSVSA